MSDALQKLIEQAQRPTVAMTVRVTKGERDRLDAACKAAGVPRADVIAAAVRDYLGKLEARNEAEATNG